MDEVRVSPGMDKYADNFLPDLLSGLYTGRAGDAALRERPARQEDRQKEDLLLVKERKGRMEPRIARTAILGGGD